jgi:SAM-dependent methyltransferase
MDHWPKGFTDASRESALASGGILPANVSVKTDCNIPAYLHDTYHWAYLSRTGVSLFDHPVIVSAILWGNYGSLKQIAISEFKSGQKVLQPACVYGNLSTQLGRFLGPEGQLDVTDVAPIQVANCQRKVDGMSQVRVWQANAASPTNGPYDAVCCFFLLHEMPDDYKHTVVDALLNCVVPGGKVVFVDYHKPHWAHPLKPLMSLIFDTLEPFAKGLWRNKVPDLATNPGRFNWRTETYFGGLYQKTVALLPPAGTAD